MAQQISPNPDEVVVEEPAAPAAEVPAEVKPILDELGALRRAVGLLCELAEPLTQPAQLTTVELTKAAPKKFVEEHGITSASIGVLNPTGVTILLGIGGGSAASSARAVSVPPESLIVLPVSASDLEVATEASLEAGTAVVHIFRYRTVQPAFLGVAP